MIAHIHPNVSTYDVVMVILMAVPAAYKNVKKNDCRGFRLPMTMAAHISMKTDTDTTVHNLCTYWYNTKKKGGKTCSSTSQNGDATAPGVRYLEGKAVFAKAVCATYLYTSLTRPGTRLSPWILASHSPAPLQRSRPPPF